MGLLIKAVQGEKERYREAWMEREGRGPVGDLAYFTYAEDVGGVSRRVNVEGLHEGPGGVAYEALAPLGFHFLEGGSVLHSLCCYSLADVRERLKCVELAPCGRECAG